MICFLVIEVNGVLVVFNGWGKNRAARSKEESGRKGKMRKKERKMRVVLGKFGNI